ncbi:uncharacterized protein LTHEOB_5783 [Lasiodiplodia theobromae]|uniref:uncharacterized protein n=1 Tax=Lasiodiplodia theobromae TaxID=45133 RepID=UPI0015C3D7D0|nr:uncharacterized protein LTHEOB_5783 [Lasiodiplodia theobromae]KAF4544774.1 hypothetical protein LTHEOB_5783 [Lasiodiplodia theobromae]
MSTPNDVTSGTRATRARLFAERQTVYRQMRFLRYIDEVNRSAMVFEEEMYDLLGDETYYSQPEQQQQQQQQQEQEQEDEGDRDGDDEEGDDDDDDDEPTEYLGDRREILRQQINRHRDELRNRRDRWHAESEAFIEARGRELAARLLPLVQDEQQQEEQQ